MLRVILLKPLYLVKQVKQLDNSYIWMFLHWLCYFDFLRPTICLCCRLYARTRSLSYFYPIDGVLCDRPWWRSVLPYWTHSGADGSKKDVNQVANDINSVPLEQQPPRGTPAAWEPPRQLHAPISFRIIETYSLLRALLLFQESDEEAFLCFFFRF